MKMKKVLATVLSAVMIAGCLTGCGSSSGDSAGTGTGDNAGSEFDSSKAITVVSREDGSGTRGAFIELFGIEEKDADGNKVDNTTEDASVTNNTSVMMSTVAGNEYAIGYISLGSLNDSVKAVKIDGNEATVDNIKSGTYKISRPFNIVTKDGLSDVAQDFIDYILSSDGQGVIEKNGYITCASGAGKRYKSPLRLTERGKAVGRAIGEKITRIVEAASEGLSEAERQTMYRALALVSENLERIYIHKKMTGDLTARDRQ